jgi:hypothetical protein
MEPFDDDGLEQILERSAAQTIGQGASLIETFMRRVREQAERGAPTAAEELRGRQSREDEPRWATATAGVRRDGGPVVPTGLDEPSEAELKEQMKARHGIDVDHLGERAHDRQWVDRAQPGDVVDLLRAADRDGEMAGAAANVRDNLFERIREYGIDPETLLGEPADVAGEKLREQRASFLDSDGHDANTSAETDRDAAEVSSLMQRAQTADRDADTLSARAQDGYASAADRSRSTEVATVSQSPAASAATLAAKDHPTNPRNAEQGAAKQAPKPKAAPGRGADRERGHAGR